MKWGKGEDTLALERALVLFNADQRNEHMPQAELDALLEFANTRLAAYGTLMPGQSNHALLADVPGTWLDGTVQGVRFMANGFPAFRWRQDEEPVTVSVLTSAALPERWARLDDFEGPDYRRILVPVRLDSGSILVAYLYEYIGDGMHPAPAPHRIAAADQADCSQ